MNVRVRARFEHYLPSQKGQLTWKPQPSVCGLVQAAGIFVVHLEIQYRISLLRVVEET